MTALSIQPTFPTFTGADGQPLENGYIWIGTANLNPITNPITVYWDAALSAPATQPIRTLGGYPSNSGTPARMYVNSDYSIQVLDRKGSVVYSAPVATERYGGGIINAADVVYDPAGTGSVATTAQAKLRERVSVKDFGAVGDGSTNDTTAIQTAVATLKAAGGGKLVFPRSTGAYKVVFPALMTAYSSLFALSSNIEIEFENGATMVASAVPGSGLFVSVFGADQTALPVSNLRFSGIVASQTTAVGGEEQSALIQLSTAPDAAASRITNVVIDGGSYTGFSCPIYIVQRTSAGTTTRQVSNVKVTNNTGNLNPSFITADGADILISGNTMVGDSSGALTTYDGVSIHSGLGIRVVDNHISYYGEHCVNLRNSSENHCGSKDVVIANNVCKSPVLKGISVTLAAGETVYGVSDVTISNNSVSHHSLVNSGSGIYLSVGSAGAGTPFKNISITGNVINGMNSGLIVSALTTTWATSFSVTGNTITNNSNSTGYSLNLTCLLQSTVSGNTVVSTANGLSNHIAMQYVYNSSVSGNSFYTDSPLANAIYFDSFYDSAVTGNSIYGKATFTTLNDRTLIDSNRIQGACTVAGRTGIVDQFRLAAGKMRMSALTTTAPVGTWVWGDRIDYINPVTTGYSGMIYVSTGVWKDYGLIT